MPHVTTERYYLTLEGQERVRAGHTAEREHVVPEGDERAAFLLYGAGVEVPDEEARRLGLKREEADEAPAVQVEGHSADVQVMQQAREKAAEEEEQKAAEVNEAKAVESAPADKAVSRERSSRK